MLSMQEISDRIEIDVLLTEYCHAIDDKEWDALDNIFTEDAIIDYTAAGGAKGNLQETKAYLDRALEQFTGSQHMVATTKLRLNGDTATARTICFNPMNTPKKEGVHTFFCGIWYVDELVRTEKGWRISSRKEELSYFHNLPDDFAAVDPNG